MDTMTNPMESRMSRIEQLSSQQGAGFALPVRGRAFTCARWTTVAVADLRITTSTIARSPKVAAKGHVALVAYVPGTHAWSPPIC